MDILYNIIEKNISTKLDIITTNQLVIDYRNYNTFSGKCAFYNYCKYGFDNNLIDPDLFLTAAVSYCDNTDKVFMVAFALRNGANPNLYVTIKNKGAYHILFYTIYHLTGKITDYNTIISMILHILAFSGASPDYLISKDPKETLKVVDYLQQSDYNVNFIKPIETAQEILNTEQQVSLGAMLDDVSVAFPNGPKTYDIVNIRYGFADRDVDYVGPDLSQIIRYHSVKCAKYVLLTSRYEKGENLEFLMCVDGGSYDIFKILLDRGLRMTYFNLNRLLVLLNSTKTEMKLEGEIKHKYSNKVYIEIYVKMLKYAISIGFPMDVEQYKFLAVYSNSISGDIREAYESEPQWSKTCKSSSAVELPESVKELAFSLNIIKSENADSYPESGEIKGDNKREVCNDLRKYSKFSKDILKQTNSRLQNSRFKSQNTIIDAAEDTYGLSNLICSNSSSIVGKPEHYTEDSLIYYKDDKNNTWCFTPDLYDSLISTGVNPNTGKRIPEPIVNKMKNVNKVLKKLNIEPKSIVSADKAIDEVFQNDKINNKKTDMAIRYVKDMSEIKGIIQIFNGLNPNDMNQILSAINLDQYYLSYLPVNYQIATFCRAVYMFYKMYSDVEISNLNIVDIDQFFDIIRKVKGIYDPDFNPEFNPEY